MFSIICPTYNSSSYLKETLESLLSQKYKKFEIIFSDDNSNDNTVEILESYKDKFLSSGINVKIIRNDHGGPGFARNKGLKYASSEWVCFLDSDDLWHENKLLKVSNIIRENQRLNCILHRQYFLGKNNKNKEYDFDKYFNRNIPVKKQLYKNNFFAMSAVTMKKKLIEDAQGFNEDYDNAQDYDLWLRIGDKFNLFIIPEYLGSYREREGNITSKPYKKRIFNILKILIKNRKDISNFNLFISIFKVFINKEWIKKYIK